MPAPVTLQYMVLRKVVKLEAFFCLATFPINLNTNSRSGASVVCALNRYMLCTHIIQSIFGLLNTLNQNLVSFKYGVKIGSVFSYTLPVSTVDVTLCSEECAPCFVEGGLEGVGVTGHQIIMRGD